MKHGFSLVELSIVLVILGLLTGGILTGQSLIRASELRAVTTEYQRYLAATQTFRDKYFAIPGDFRDATRFWGRAVVAADCVTNSSAGVATPGTCDGDGDGTMDTAGAASQSGENFRFWQHLALAGLVEGTYSGNAGAGGIWDSSATNSPRSKISNAGWNTAYLPNFAGNTDLYALDYGNLFNVGIYSAGGAVGAFIRPEEAWNIDTKLDDGRPAYGKVVARYWNNLCAAADDGSHANNDFVASYKLADASLQCALYFVKAF